MNFVPASPQPGVRHPDWSRHAALYEVNVRQHSPGGGFDGVTADLPRLAEMGVGIVWLMPIHPIGALHRKGALGSYYAVSNHLAVNPEFGTPEDLHRLVSRAHQLGMKVLLDWVANHTAWDHVWVQQHPEWFRRDAEGRLRSLTFGEGEALEEWTDVIGLDYTQRSLWPAMTDAMAHWVREFDVDGFRCDVAGLVPTPFWNQARAALDRIKPVFMLAEWSDPALHEQAFDMTYDWALYEVMKRVARGQENVDALQRLLEQPAQHFPVDAYRMCFTGNHDTNSWHGSDEELYGPAFPAMVVLAATLYGMPLVYGGQEAPYDKRLRFFERDPIDWKQRALQPLYADLLALKRRHRALAHGSWGAPPRVLPTGHPRVFAFERRLPGDAVTVVLNFSDQPQQVQLAGRSPRSLAPWGHHIEEET